MKYTAKNATAPSLATYHEEISRYPLLTREQEKALGRRIQNGDEDARREMIESNLRLVVTIAHDFAHRGLPLEDLIAEGNVGLMTAAERYDPENGAKFSTYAAWWIKQNMRAAAQNQVRTIRVPTHVQSRAWAIDKATTKLEVELGRDPSVTELAEATELTPEQVEFTKRSVQPISHLESVVGGPEGGTEFGELIADIEADTPDEEACRWDDIRQVNDYMEELSDREQRILVKRFGLEDDEPTTLSEVGKHVGLTRERVRQLQNGAVDHLRVLFNEVEDQPTTLQAA